MAAIDLREPRMNARRALARSGAGEDLRLVIVSRWFGSIAAAEPALP
jgi:hypothetical protein